MTSDIIKFEKKLRIKFKDRNLLQKALTHKSSNQKFNNEKLEFLGDRVIALILSKKLIDLYPNEEEGILDKRLAKLVNRQTCCLVGWSMGLQKFIILGNSKKKVTLDDEKIISDCCEAVVGAIYTDLGFSMVKKFVLKCWSNKIKESNVTILDSKTMLQEYSLKTFKKLPNYRVENASGPKHNPIFKISVSIVGSKKYFGSGKSKQHAEQNCAKNLLKDINLI
jgi:ribonuclease-3